MAGFGCLLPSCRHIMSRHKWLSVVGVLCQAWGFACSAVPVVVQVLKDTAPGVAAGGETRTQTWCCAAPGLQHFDISYWAFEKLVHPVSGEQPRDCGEGEQCGW
jgi:hypothetical protein